MDWITYALVIFLMALCVGYMLLFFLIKPTKTEHQLDFLKYAPIAHRGLHDVTRNDPENSMKAFTQAIEAGYPIETDLWLTKDAVPVVFHDGDTKRMCGVAGHVREMTLEEVKALRLAGTDEQIPTLAELLTLVNGRIGLLIEFKGNGDTDLERLAHDQLCRYNGRYAVQAFHPNSMKWFKKYANRVCRGQLSADFRKDKTLSAPVRFAMTHLLVNVISRPHFVSYQYQGVGRYEPRAVRRMKGGLFAWTVPDQETADRLKSKVDNVIFEGFRAEQ